MHKLHINFYHPIVLWRRHAKKNDDGRSVTCELRFTKVELVIAGLGRNKHNAKLSAAHKAVKDLRKIGKIQ